MADKHTLAFEIGVEEIPAFDLDSANKQLEKMVPAAFADARIPYDSIEIHSSPRRLIVMAYGVADATEALVEEYKGPAAKIAFDADGNPTEVTITLNVDDYIQQKLDAGLCQPLKIHIGFFEEPFVLYSLSNT